MSFKYAAFISYKHTNILPFAKILSQQLRSYAKPLFSPPLSIFRDEDLLVPGGELPKIIRHALADSEYLILLASPSAAKSTWVQDEVFTWCSELGRSDRLIIVLLEGSISIHTSSKKVDWLNSDALPSCLNTFVTEVPLYVDLSRLTKPEELDCGNPIFKAAVNNISARIRGVTPYELISEEIAQHKRYIRLRTFFVSALIFFLGIAVMAVIYANVQKEEQERATNLALANSLALSSIRHENNRDSELSALLAKQSFLFGSRTSRPILDSVNRALRASLSRNDFNRVLKFEMEFIGQIALSGDGTMIAAVGENSLARVWDIHSPTTTMILDNGVNMGGTIVALKSSGTHAAIGGGNDGVIYLWDLEEGETKFVRLEGHAGSVTALAFHPSKPLLASGSRDGIIRIWSLGKNNGKGKILHSSPTVPISLQFFEDEKVLASYVDGQVELLAPDLEVPPRLLISRTNDVSIAEFSANGKAMVTAGFGVSSVFLWDLSDGEKEPIEFPLPESLRMGNFQKSVEKGGLRLRLVSSAALSPDASYLAVGTNQGIVLLWRTESPTTSPRIYEAHRDIVSSLKFANGGDLLASSGGVDGEVRLWDLSISNLAPQVFRDSTSVSFTPTDKWLLAIDQEQDRVIRWDLMNPSEEVELLVLDSENETPIFSTNGGLAILNAKAGNVQVWDPTLPRESTRYIGFNRVSRKRIGAKALDANASILAWADTRNASVGIIDLDNEKHTAIVLEGPGGSHNAPPTFNQEGKPTNVLSFGTRSWSIPLAVSGEGRMIAMGTGDKTIHVWDRHHVESPPRILRGLAGWPLDLTFSNNGNIIASANSDGSTYVWDLSSENLSPQKLRGHVSRVDAVALSPDAKMLVSGAADGSVLLWNLTEDQPRPVRLISASPIVSLTFSHSGHRLAVSDSDYRTYLLVVEPAELAEGICEKVGRNLTFFEWTQWVGPEVGYERTCSNLPVHPSLLQEARKLAASGNDSASTALFQQVASLEPDSVLDPSVESSRATARALAVRAENLARNARIDEGSVVLQRALELDPTLEADFSLRYTRAAVEGLLSEARRLNEEENYEEAIRAVNQAIKLSPNHPEAFAIRGEFLAARGMNIEAIKDFQRAIELNAQDWRSHMSRADILVSLEQYGKAVMGYKATLRIINQGLQSIGPFSNNELGVAGKKFQVLLDLLIAQEVALMQRANALFLQGNYPEAIADYSRILDRKPSHLEARYNRAQVFQASRNCQKAIKDLSKVIESSPEMWQAYANRARCRLELEELPGALRDINQAITLVPDNQDLKKLAEKVGRMMGDSQ